MKNQRREKFAVVHNSGELFHYLVITLRYTYITEIAPLASCAPLVLRRESSESAASPFSEDAQIKSCLISM